jgi:hypothetical protein
MTLLSFLPRFIPNLWITGDDLLDKPMGLSYPGGMTEPPEGTERYVARTLGEYLIKTSAGRGLMEMDPAGPKVDRDEGVDPQDALQTLWFNAQAVNAIVRGLGQEIDSLQDRIAALEGRI